MNRRDVGGADSGACLNQNTGVVPAMTLSCEKSTCNAREDRASSTRWCSCFSFCVVNASYSLTMVLFWSSGTEPSNYGCTVLLCVVAQCVVSSLPARRVSTPTRVLVLCGSFLCCSTVRCAFPTPATFVLCVSTKNFDGVHWHSQVCSQNFCH